MNTTVSRKNTTLLMEMVREGIVNPEILIQNLVNWMSEDEVTEFMVRNGYMYVHEDEE